MPTTTDKKSGLQVIPLWIDGAPATSTPEITFQVVSAEKKKDVYVAQAANPEACKRAVDSAVKAFRTYKSTSLVQRREWLAKVVELLKARSNELVNLQMEETSCVKGWAASNVNIAGGLVEEIAARLSGAMVGDIPPIEDPESLGLVFKEPIGTVLAIAPWNASVILATRALATPLAAGCTVVLKASELSPRTHHFLAEIFNDAGFPKGTLNVVQARREDGAATTEALIAHPGIRKIEFIGSAAVGKMIGQVAAKYLKPILMELGGKAPAIVLDDANLNEAAQKVVLGAYMHHGQICMSTERVIVLAKVADEFTKILKEAASKFPTGSGVSERIVKQSHEKLVDAEKKGAKFLVGEAKIHELASLKPVILTNVTKDMDIADEESFGPSMSLYVAKDDEEAIKIANDTVYGMNAAIHSTNMPRALRIARELEYAGVHINGLTVHDEPNLPIGGNKASGYGRNNSHWGLDEFMITKSVTLPIPSKF